MYQITFSVNLLLSCNVVLGVISIRVQRYPHYCKFERETNSPHTLFTVFTRKV